MRTTTRHTSAQLMAGQLPRMIERPRDRTQRKLRARYRKAARTLSAALHPTRLDLLEEDGALFQ